MLKQGRWSKIGVLGLVVVACGGEIFNDVGDLEDQPAGEGGSAKPGSGAGGSGGSAGSGAPAGFGHGGDGSPGRTEQPASQAGAGGAGGEAPETPGESCHEGCFEREEGKCDCPWVDETTQLMWQDPPELDQVFNVFGGSTYCTGLIFAGRGDWRLPTIDELRTLIRGCPGTVSGGACPVVVGSPSSDGLAAPCGGCGPDEGPGRYFEFWVPELSGESNYSEYFSSTVVADDGESAWYVNFLTGEIAAYGRHYGMRVRCVRSLD